LVPRRNPGFPILSLPDSFVTLTPFFGLDADRSTAKIGVLGNPLSKERRAMSTRERWVVYPLLFLTLGIALRDKVVPRNTLRVREVVCERLVCNRSECRTLLVNGPKDRPVVIAGTDVNTRAGTIETFTENGVPQVRLLSTDTGGMVTTIGHAGKVILVMGHTGQNFGVFAQVPELGPPIPLTLPWRFEAKPSHPQPPKEPAAPGQTPDKSPPQKAQEPEKKT
jgi:hypothetical protein